MDVLRCLEIPEVSQVKRITAIHGHKPHTRHHLFHRVVMTHKTSDHSHNKQSLPKPGRHQPLAEYGNKRAHSIPLMKATIAKKIMINISTRHTRNTIQCQTMCSTDLPSGYFTTWRKSAAPHAHIKNRPTTKKYQ